MAGDVYADGTNGKEVAKSTDKTVAEESSASVSVTIGDYKLDARSTWLILVAGGRQRIDIRYSLSSTLGC